MLKSSCACSWFMEKAASARQTHGHHCQQLEPPSGLPCGIVLQTPPSRCLLYSLVCMIILSTWSEFEGQCSHQCPHQQLQKSEREKPRCGGTNQHALTQSSACCEQVPALREPTCPSSVHHTGLQGRMSTQCVSRARKDMPLLCSRSQNQVGGRHVVSPLCGFSRSLFCN